MTAHTVVSFEICCTLLDAKHQIIYNFNHFNLKLFATTLTELNAMAAPAIIGFKRYPFTGYKIPAAIGMPIKL